MIGILATSFQRGEWQGRRLSGFVKLVASRADRLPIDLFSRRTCSQRYWFDNGSILPPRGTPAKHPPPPANIHPSRGSDWAFPEAAKAENSKKLGKYGPPIRKLAKFPAFFAVYGLLFFDERL
jgi:hypothetical protein